MSSFEPPKAATHIEIVRAFIRRNRHDLRVRRSTERIFRRAYIQPRRGIERLHSTCVRARERNVRIHSRSIHVCEKSSGSLHPIFPLRTARHPLCPFPSRLTDPRHYVTWSFGRRAQALSIIFLPSFISPRAPPLFHLLHSPVPSVFFLSLVFVSSCPHSELARAHMLSGDVLHLGQDLRGFADLATRKLAASISSE